MREQASRASAPRATNVRAIVLWAIAVGLVAAMAIDTKVVRIGSSTSVAPGGFSAAEYGAAEFPKVQSAIDRRAVPAATLAAAIARNATAAAKQYGTAASAGPEMPVKFTGVAGKDDFGTYDIAVPGLPKTISVKVQTGPAILGTDLRDATGTINFGQFTNQIEYQNAGAALNKQLKKDVLAKVGTSSLSGKHVSVVGVFQLTDPGSWLVTPVDFEVK